MRKRIFALEVQPLKEKNYTGIPKVAAAYAQLMLDDPEIEPRFFAQGKWISNSVIDIAVNQNSGWIFGKLGHLFNRTIDGDACRAEQAVALFPNYKTCAGLFARESFILHDMSVFDLPGFHTEDNARVVKQKLLVDCQTSDYIFCVSKATQREFVKFDFAAPFAERVVVAYNGVDELPSGSSLAASQSSAEITTALNGRKLITVLGTLEPRKSIDRLLKFFAENPSWLDKFQVRIMGKIGWGSTFDNMVDTFGIRSMVDAGHIVFEGYVTEQRKDALLRHSALLVYPSIYEGFGLPVAEAMLRGGLVLTSNKTSLPEVGGEHAQYYDPDVDRDFERVLTALLQGGLSDSQLDRQRRIDWIRNSFSWQSSYELIKNKLLA